MTLRGETNIGELARKKLSIENTYTVGLTTHHGTVTASTNWDGPAHRKYVRPGLEHSYEDLFHHVGSPSFYIILRSNDPHIHQDRCISQDFSIDRLQRFIGVIYRPENEKQSHYFHTKMASQYDAVIHIDRSSAVKPLDGIPAIVQGEEETFPFGL